MTNTVNDVKTLMQSNPLWDVAFRKKNGELRQMIATRDWEFLEENSGEMQYEKPTQSASFDADALGYVRVWDCNELGWRCIPVGKRLIKMVPID
ncbi:MAG: DUF2693 domain-containing protein [Bacteroidales bacterium]|nr:DUF2693 domain-containing protein [Bacteroidales bacterium]